MAFDNPPFVMDATTTDGEVIRRAIATLLSPAGGIVTPGDLQVTQQASPNMSVLVGTGEIWVPGTSTATQGPYYSRNGAPLTVAVSASNPSLPRVDTIVCQVQDPAYAGATKSIGIPAPIVGTPTSGVTVPPTTAAQAATDGAGAVPASSLVLAYVLVPAGATSIVTADIANVVGTLLGPWQDLTIGTATGGVTNAVRQTGATVTLRGTLLGVAGGTYATVPVASMFPPQPVNFPTWNGSAFTLGTISTSGDISVATPFTEVVIDGVSWQTY